MAVKFDGSEYKKITLDEMMEFIEENYPKDKGWFKKVAFQDKDGNTTEKYNHLNAVRKFCEKYAPNLIPKAKAKKPSAIEKFEKW